MLRNRPVQIALPFLLVAAIAFGTYRYTKRPRLAGPPTKPHVLTTTATIVTAAEVIQPRTVITEDLVKEETVSVGATPDTDIISKKADCIGSVAARLYLPRNPICKSGLYGPVSKVGLPWLIPPFKRAVVLPINPEEQLAYALIRPGDHVDIVAALDVGALGGGAGAQAGAKGGEEKGGGTGVKVYSRTILENVPVLAIDQSIGDYKLALRGPGSAAAQQEYDNKMKDYNALPPAKKGEGEGKTPPPKPPPPPPSSLIVAVDPKECEQLALLDPKLLAYALHPMPGGEWVAPEVPRKKRKGTTLADLAPDLVKEAPPPAKAAPVAPPPLPPTKGPIIVVKKGGAEKRKPPPPAQPTVYSMEVITGSSRKTVEMPKP